MPTGSWRDTAAATAVERGTALAKSGAVETARCIWQRAIDANVTSSQGGTGQYAVVVRWPRGSASLPLCMCSCPDSRPGYCKHAAAVLEYARPSHHKRPAWLESAYKPGDQSEDTDADRMHNSLGLGPQRDWILRFHSYENWLQSCEKPYLQSIFNTAIVRDPACLRVISQMLGGSDAAAEGYQEMTATRLFDTRHLIEHASLSHMRWIMLFLLMDACVPWIQKRARELNTELPSPIEDQQTESGPGEAWSQPPGAAAVAWSGVDEQGEPIKRRRHAPTPPETGVIKIEDDDDEVQSGDTDHRGNARSQKLFSQFASGFPPQSPFEDMALEPVPNAEKALEGNIKTNQRNESEEGDDDDEGFDVDDFT